MMINVDSCTRNLLCIHKRSLVHAQHSCALWAREPTGQGPKKAAVQGLGPAQLPVWVPAPWVRWPRACTRVLRMHKRSLEHTQEILLCVRRRSPFSKSIRLSVVLKAVHVQQPEPIVETLLCLLNFPILVLNRFRPKMEP